MPVIERKGGERSDGRINHSVTYKAQPTAMPADLGPMTRRMGAHKVMDPETQDILPVPRNMAGVPVKDWYIPLPSAPKRLAPLPTLKWVRRAKALAEAFGQQVEGWIPEEQVRAEKARRKADREVYRETRAVVKAYNDARGGRKALLDNAKIIRERIDSARQRAAHITAAKPERAKWERTDLGNWLPELRRWTLPGTMPEGALVPYQGLAKDGSGRKVYRPVPRALVGKRWGYREVLVYRPPVVREVAAGAHFVTKGGNKYPPAVLRDFRGTELPPHIVRFYGEDYGKQHVEVLAHDERRLTYAAPLTGPGVPRSVPTERVAKVVLPLATATHTAAPRSNFGRARTGAPRRVIDPVGWDTPRVKKG